MRGTAIEWPQSTAQDNADEGDYGRNLTDGLGKLPICQVLKKVGIPGAISQKPFPGAGLVEGGLQVGEGFGAAEGVGP